MTWRILDVEPFLDADRGDASVDLAEPDQPAAQVLGYVTGMDLADAAGTKDCDSDHGFLRL